MTYPRLSADAKIVRLLLAVSAVALLLASFGVPAFAHPEQADDGLANAPVNPNIALLTNPTDNDANGIAQQPARNPTCSGHTD